MSISFEESMKKAQEDLIAKERAAGRALVATAGETDDGTGSWQMVTDLGYEFYGEYSDDNMSTVDADKNIILHPKQINITQEANSQYIPFQMSRYYDGYDLASAKLQFYFVNREGMYGVDYPVDVYCNDEKLKFAWLVDQDVTMLDGKIKFEIQAIGLNSKNEMYIWKTRPNSDMNIILSLSGTKFIEPDDAWQQNFLTSVNNYVISATEQAKIAADAATAAQSHLTAAEEYAQAAAASASEAKQVVEDLQNDFEEEVQEAFGAQISEIVDEKVNTALSNYYDKSAVDELIANIDISDQLDDVKQQIENLDGLANFNVEYDGKTMTFYNGTAVMKEIKINSDPSEGWTDAYTATVDEKVGNVQSDLDSFKQEVNDSHYKKSETYSVDEIDDKLANVKVDLTGYATETYVDNKVAPISTSVTTNAGNISSLSKTVVDLQDAVRSIDTSPRLTYDVVYNDTEDENSGENKLVFYEIENEGKENEVKTPKKIYTITGGGGGSASSNTFYINYDADEDGNKITSYVFTIENVQDNKAIIRYDFSGVDSAGDSVSYANSIWKFRKGTSGQWTTIAAETVYPNNDIEFNISKYIPSANTYQFRLDLSDDTGAFATKTWTVQSTDLRLELALNDQFTYPIGTLAFDYTPYGAISKDVHFILDGREIGTVTTTASGIPMPYTLPAQEHGAHLLEAYITANVSGNIAESNHVLKDVLWVDPNSNIPIIGCTQQRFTARQYDTTTIVFTVHDPSTELPTVILAEDGNVISTKSLESATDIWQYKSSVVGDHTLTITCGETVKTLIVTVEKLDITLESVTAGLVFDFNPVGKSNSDTDRLWSDGDISMSVSKNFDWVNGGYQLDENGDQYFCIKAGTSAVINYQLFADDAKKNGKEFKLVFKSTNVQTANATFLHCIDNTTDSNHIGIQMNVHEAYIYGQANSLQLPYSEDDIIEFEFNISKNTEAIPMVMGYEDGVSTCPMVYDDAFDFTQNTPKYISLGSDYCDLHIYRFKVYNTSLNARGILNNFIADARNADEMIARYNRNQIYDENQNLDPDILAEKCPQLRVYKLSAPYFTNKKSDKVPGTTIQQIYKNGDPVLDNWTCYNAQHSGQGTSSDNYGAAGRNIDFIMNKSGVDGIKPYFILGNGTEASEITMTRASVPVAYLNFKANIASSNNMTNAMLANRYNEFNPYNRPFVREEGVDTSFIRDTMQFANAVVFIQETNEDVSTHREFADNDWHFYAIGNIGDSKKTDNTRLTDPNDIYECCVEIMDVELPLSDWPADTMYNAMGYKVDEKTGEKIYTWAKDENLGILYEKIDGEYVLTQDTAINLDKTYYVDILEHDDFSEDYTYGWRYIYEGDDDEENAEIAEFCHQKWNELYRFVTTSSDEEFKAHLGDYFVIDSALYYYLFTTRYCMIDNRAKNTFLHYGKTGEVDSDGNPIRKWDLTWAYDLDSSLGLNNYGMQAYRHGLEDIDVDEKGEEVFRESDSTFFCRIRDLFPNELRAMYNTLESQNAWHAESFINQADAWQSEFPEELWRIDIERKYIRSYNGSFINGEGDAQFLKNMCNGRMKYHRRQWERAQEKYMASKYQSSVASSDNAVLRCTVPTGDLVVEPNYRLKLTPYDYMYLNVKYGTQNPIQLRAEPGVEYEIPFEGSSADIIDIYSSSLIQSFGDLSSCYPATVDTSKAKKIKELIIGNETDGYDNPSLTTLTIGANDLLEVLNIENVSGLTQTLDMSALHNLRELYAHGSNVAGATLAPGGKIEIVELPAINSITMRNLLYLNTLDITSLNNLTRLVVENCSTVDLLAIINSAPNLNRIRVIGVDWQLEDASILERIFAMAGIDNNGYNTAQSVLTGAVHVPTIKQQQLYDFQTAWPDLDITFETMVEQFAVTFHNEDGTLLETQYVDKGSSAVDPTTREENPMVPTKESTVSHDFTFAAWDSSLTDVFSDRAITATYTSTLRNYTLKYVSMGITMQESKGKYGDYIPYTGANPTYTAEEGAYAYYLFSRWDKSGLVDGDKTVTAIFDKFIYTNTAFDGKELSDLTPVELYALTKLNLAGTVIDDKDSYSITLGNDVTYDDIAEQIIISEKTEFTGSNYIDTGIKLLDEDKDFVLAIDYEFLSGNSTNAVLAQCFQSNGTNGFKLWYADGTTYTGSKFTWGTTAENLVSENKREMLVIRHVKGNDNLTIYNSNLDGDDISVVELKRTRTTSGDCSLVFGCARADDGIYENYAIGNINWCKLWYADLGDDICRGLAVWPHEKIGMEACGFRKYYLTDNPSQRCSFSLLATNLLDRNQKWSADNVNSNDGGWGASALNAMLNTRLYEAIPTQLKSLIKKVEVPSSLGNKSTEIGTTGCYITIPACIEVDPTMTTEPYVNEGSSISYFSTNDTRKRAYSNGSFYQYWLRSPNHLYTNYVFRVNADGSLYGFNTPNYEAAVLIEISI